MADGMRIFSMFGDIFIKDNDTEAKIDKIDKKANKLNISLSGLSNEAGKAIRGVNKEFELWSVSTNKAGNSSEYLKKKLDGLNKAMEIMNKDIEKSKNDYDKVVEKFGETSNQAEKYRNKITNLEISHAKLSKEIRDTQKHLEDTGDKFEQYGKKIENVLGTITKWGTGILTGALAAGTALYKVAESASIAGSKIDDMSQITGLATSTLQELRYATQLSGVNFDIVTTSVTGLTRALKGADGNSKEVTQAFERLKIKTEDVNDQMKDMDDIYIEVIEKLANMDNETERNALAMTLLGKSAMDLAPLFNQGAEGIKKLRTEANELGLVMGEESIQAAAKYGDSIDRLTMIFEAIKNGIGIGLIPMFQELADNIEENGPQIKDTILNISGVVGDFALFVGDNFPAVISIIEGLTAVWLIQKGVLAALAINKVIDWTATKLIALETSAATKGTIAYTVVQKANSLATGIATGINLLFGTSLQFTGKHLLIVAAAIAIVVGLILLLTKGFKGARSEIEQTMGSMSSFSNIANQAQQSGYNQYANSIPGFATGINRVPGDMIAMIHKDEAVIPAKYNPFSPNAEDGGLGETNNFYGDVVIEARTIRELNDVFDFFKEYRRVMRQGGR